MVIEKVKAYRNLLREYAGITIGVIIIAIALNMFLIPNRLAAGGVSGLSTVLFYKLGFPV
ncbi:MAG: YitT family protein, partial [Actinomycetota bacterium]|nr:YitT family protein [Actinomycetota bacterium]